MHCTGMWLPYANGTSHVYMMLLSWNLEVLLLTTRPNAETSDHELSMPHISTLWCYPLCNTNSYLNLYSRGDWRQSPRLTKTFEVEHPRFYSFCCIFCSYNCLLFTCINALCGAGCSHSKQKSTSVIIWPWIFLKQPHLAWQQITGKWRNVWYAEQCLDGTGCLNCRHGNSPWCPTHMPDSKYC